MNAVVPRKRRKARPRLSGAVPLLIEEHSLHARYSRGEIEVYDGAEPENPNRTVRRGRRVCAYDQMERVGAISEDQRDAADRYAILREQELGASWLNGEPNGRAPSPWQKGNPTQTAIHASATLRSVHEVLGQQARTVLNLLIMQNMDAKAIAAHLGINPSVAKGRVDAALTRMVEHWGVDGEKLRNWSRDAL